MTQRPLNIPDWAPAAAAAALVIWAASIWWMVATLPSGGDTGAIEEVLDAVVAELEAANAEIETLGSQIAAIEEERNALVARLDDLESRGPVEGAFQMSADEAPEDGEGAEGTDDSASPQSSPFFTDGADRYNCRDFASHAEAAEALDVNGPSDPNRIDTNRNGLACEDFKYPTASAATPAVGTSDAAE